jgi:hypothetical protein
MGCVSKFSLRHTGVQDIGISAPRNPTKQEFCHLFCMGVKRNLLFRGNVNYKYMKSRPVRKVSVFPRDDVSGQFKILHN